MDAIDSAFCICCRRSVSRVGGGRRRSYSLNAEFVENHPQLMQYFFEIANIRQVTLYFNYTLLFSCSVRINKTKGLTDTDIGDMLNALCI